MTTDRPATVEASRDAGPEKRSAVGVAALRFAGSFESDVAVRNPDRLSGELLPKHLALLGRVAPLRRMALPIYRRAYPGSYEYHVARTRLIDDLLLEAVRRGVEQVVILGAGFDTRAHRFREELRDVPVFELDHPSTSRRKREALAALPPCPNLTLIEIDFDRDRADVSLAAHGYRAPAATFFIWEGVSMFLEPAAVDSTLDLVRDAGPGSSIVFDYVLRSVVHGDRSPRGAMQTARYLERGGEVWKFGLDIDEVEGFLAERGFATELNLGPSDLEARFLRRTDGGLLGPVVGFHGIAHAVVRRGEP